MNALIENARFVPSIVQLLALPGPNRSIGEHRYTTWGPTVDQVVCIAREIRWAEVKDGD